MKIIVTALALAFAIPAAAQPASAQHQGHDQHQQGQHGQHGQGQHGQHQQGQHGQHQQGQHDEHRGGCCQDGDGNGRMDCCEAGQGCGQGRQEGAGTRPN